MLFKFCLQNRWVKAALTVTECQAMVLNGLWDQNECRELMRTKLADNGLKLPKLVLNARAADVRPKEKVMIKVEVTRVHCYTEEEMAKYKNTLTEGECETREGWWMIAESLRNNGKNDATHKSGQVVPNALVGWQAMGPALDAPTMTCEFEFEAPETPGEYKIMVHVRSSGTVGVDVRRKVSFQVLPTKRVAAMSSESSELAFGDPEETGSGVTVDDVPPLEEHEEPPQLTTTMPN